ncbi:ferredoxin [Geodermatophilus sp. CPCC 206100]|uniref:ferredoxin n=1 Tax=Geodermatophilus sp. CPCC 206100 TaxID=3020054 RepID=UPI003B00FDD2
MRVEIEPGRCISSGQCVLIAGSVFDQDEEDGIVVLRTEDVPAADEEAARDAARICPAQAIRTTDTG